MQWFDARLQQTVHDEDHIFTEDLLQTLKLDLEFLDVNCAHIQSCQCIDDTKMKIRASRLVHWQGADVRPQRTVRDEKHTCLHLFVIH